MLSSTVYVLHVDDIPVRGFIGRLEEGNFIPHVHKVLFFTHHVFNIEYNEDQVGGVLTTRKAAWFIILVNFVCLSVRR